LAIIDHDMSGIDGVGLAARKVDGAARRPDRGPSPAGPSILVAEDNPVQPAGRDALELAGLPRRRGRRTAARRSRCIDAGATT
jgi:hypothetical protein